MEALGQYVPDQDRELSKGIKWSAIVHLGLLSFALIKGLIFPSDPVLYVPTLRVDIVDLPDVLKKDLTKISPVVKEQLTKPLPIPEKPKVKEKPAPKANPDEMVLKPKKEAAEKARKKRLESALDRIKALNKINEEVKVAQPIKGNQISKGSSLSGDAKESAMSSYYDHIREKLQENWALPVWIARQNYSAQVQIYIDKFGKIESYKFVKLSGNAQFDEAIKKTMLQSQPFTVPPSDVAGSLSSNGILVGFPL